MLDCGVHPGRPGIAGLPFFDEIEPENIDLLLISHFHLDHCAALPYFMEKTAFHGKVYMTHPTKPIYKMILSDYVKVSNIAINELLYDASDVERTMDKIEAINYHQEIAVEGVRFWCYNAGHVLGAAMFMIEIAGVHVLYTGDYSRQESRHLMAAEIPSPYPDVLIVESTYGIQNHEPRLTREKRFKDQVTRTVRGGGRCLIPAFAMGSAQELLLILEEHWRHNSELHHIPIYYASPLAARCMKVYQAYINMMNESIIERSKFANPFDFKHIQKLTGIDKFVDSGPCVVMASPGMLQSGLSRELMEKWCDNAKNTVIIPGYCVEGTLAKEIMNSPQTIKSMTGETLPLRMTVEYVSFSAHSDYQQTEEFIDILQPPHIVLVHGDGNEMNRMRKGLEEHFRDVGRECEIWTPPNTMTVSIPVKSERNAVVIGRLAEGSFEEGTIISGILVEKGFKHSILDASDVSAYSNLSTAGVYQSQRVPFKQPFKLLSSCLTTMYEHIEKTTHREQPALFVSNAVYVMYAHSDYLRLEWESDPVNDMLADSILSLILQIEANPATHTLYESCCCSNQMEKAQVTVCFLQRHFPEVRFDSSTRTIIIDLPDGKKATINLKTNQILCEDEQYRKRIDSVLQNVRSATEPF